MYIRVTEAMMKVNKALFSPTVMENCVGSNTFKVNLFGKCLSDSTERPKEEFGSLMWREPSRLCLTTACLILNKISKFSMNSGKVCTQNPKAKSKSKGRKLMRKSKNKKGNKRYDSRNRKNDDKYNLYHSQHAAYTTPSDVG